MGRHSKKPQKAKLSTKEKLREIKKAKKQKLREKRARLVVHNIPFQTTEEDLKEHFGKFGDIEEVKILKKEDGLLVGCAFVQFKLVQKARKARHYTNGKPFLGRDISVDFSLAKNKYEEKVKVKQENEVKIKEEPIDVDEITEPTTDIKTEVEEIKEETESSNDDGAIRKQNEEMEVEEAKKEDIEQSEEEDDEKGDEQDAESDEEEDQQDNDNEEIADEEDTKAKRSRFESNDVNEGKTIFIKNVPFTATNEDLKQCMCQFGPIYYALICVDKFTEHSKGTAFVKFQEKEDAEKALQAGTELTLLGNILDCHKAVSKNELQQKSMVQKQEKVAPKDSRNLYLVKEGVILAGTKAAEGVSASDMTKRLQLEQYKTQMLRNLNMFVSRERLVIHNLPPSWDDKKLRELFKKYSPKNAFIKEARVMRDLRNVNAEGVGRSKEFGFITFTKHEDALAALRTLNNNPNIFSDHKRPIVAFSIENKSAVKAKQKRLEKSRLKNPKCKDYDSNIVKIDEEKKKRLMEKQEEDKQAFVGVTAKPGAVQKMRSKFKLKNQAKLHFDNLKKEKKKQKFAKKSLKERQQDFIKQPKQKINKKKQNDHFSKLISNYKKMLNTSDAKKKTKWYDS